MPVEQKEAFLTSQVGLAWLKSNVVPSLGHFSHQYFMLFGFGMFIWAWINE